MNKIKRVKLVIKGVPVAKQSMRITRQGFRYKDPKVKQEEGNIRAQVIAQLPFGFIPLSGAIRVESLLFVFPRPKNHYYTGRRSSVLRPNAPLLKTTKPDLLDNLPKLLFDALNGVVIEDDRMIVECCGSKKIFGSVPRIEVELVEIDPLTGKALDAKFELVGSNA